MLNLPFHYAIDDAMFYSFAWLGSGNAAQRITDPDRVFDLWWAAFWQQYRVGGYLNIVVHPFVSGRALRIEMMDRLITRMKTLPGVWFPTCEQVARHCLETLPAAARPEREATDALEARLHDLGRNRPAGRRGPLAGRQPLLRHALWWTSAWRAVRRESAPPT